MGMFGKRGQVAYKVPGLGSGSGFASGRHSATLQACLTANPSTVKICEGLASVLPLRLASWQLVARAQHAESYPIG